VRCYTLSDYHGGEIREFEGTRFCRA
jgi:hypothetical protein